MRICIDCKIEKELTFFHKSKLSKVTGKQWYKNRCKKCHNLKYQPATGKENIGRFKKDNIAWNKGLEFSQEIRDKMSLAKRGKPSPNKGKPGKKWTQEQIENYKKRAVESWVKKRQTHIAVPNSRCSSWSHKIRNRDDNTCQHCGSKEKLHAHHIIPWNTNIELRYDLSNGITLCNSCHHKLEGFQKGHASWNKGKKMSDEHRKKLSEAHKGKIPWNKKEKI